MHAQGIFRETYLHSDFWLSYYSKELVMTNRSQQLLRHFFLTQMDNFKDFAATTVKEKVSGIR